jgi:hypothetical protein
MLTNRRGARGQCLPLLAIVRNDYRATAGTEIGEQSRQRMDLWRVSLIFPSFHILLLAAVQIVVVQIAVVVAVQIAVVVVIERAFESTCRQSLMKSLLDSLEVRVSVLVVAD